MILLDTNVISEMMKSLPLPRVIAWLDRQESSQLYISTVTIAEISYGLGVLPNGKRRHYLEKAFHKVLKYAFNQRILPFHEAAAFCYGKLMANRKNKGRPMSVLDGQIAAIASAHEAALATRNVRDFEGCQLELIDPFNYK